MGSSISLTPGYRQERSGGRRGGGGKGHPQQESSKEPPIYQVSHISPPNTSIQGISRHPERPRGCRLLTVQNVQTNVNSRPHLLLTCFLSPFLTFHPPQHQGPTALKDTRRNPNAQTRIEEEKKKKRKPCALSVLSPHSPMLSPHFSQRQKHKKKKRQRKRHVPYAIHDNAFIPRTAPPNEHMTKKSQEKRNQAKEMTKRHESECPRHPT